MHHGIRYKIDITSKVVPVLLLINFFNLVVGCVINLQLGVLGISLLCRLIHRDDSDLFTCNSRRSYILITNLLWKDKPRNNLFN